jgi:DNA-3-methyladenine glycosylase I
MAARKTQTASSDPAPTRVNDGRVRCGWAVGGNELYHEYHDLEWGVPVRDDRRHFEFLVLEAAQAGLSWSTVLNKRIGYRRAFADFDPLRVARLNSRSVARLLNNPGIIRNRLKIEAAIHNARRFLEVQEKFGSFDRYVWPFVGGAPIQHGYRRTRQVPATTRESDALSKDLKQRGFRFVGSTVIYAHMQAVGMVNDHLVDCFRHPECAALSW